MVGSDLGGGGVEFWRAEAARWRAEAQRLAAEDAVLRGQVADLRGQVGALTEKVSVLARMVFGTSSEKAAKRASGKDGAPGGSCGDDVGGDKTPGGGPKRPRGQRRGSRGHGRRDYSHLPTREEIHDVAPGERVCPCCGAGYAPFGEQTCEQIDWQVQLIRIVHRRRTYRRSCGCPVRGVLVAPPVPKAIAKGRFTSGFLARLLVEKFVLGRPAHRIVAALAHDGLDVAEGTLAGVFAACSDLLAPLAAAISDRNAAAAHLHVDETSWQVYAAVQGKDSHRWWCWVFVGPDTTVFRIAPSRSLKVLTEQLGIDTDADTDALPDALPGGRQVLLSSDFYAVYQSLGRIEGVGNLWCWSHIRRYFIRAGDAHPELATWTAGWVERIAALYVAHTALAAATPASPAHTWAGAQFSAALNTIDADRRAQARHPELSHPAAAKVLATLDREWEGLARHREFPELPLDNNTSERAPRGPVVGRKNYYGSGSVVSAELASRVFTITATAGRAGLNPLAYLHAYLDECARAGGTAPTAEALTRFLPWAASPDDLTAWAYRSRPQTTETDTTGTDTHPDTGPAP
jgi:transposase